MKCPNCKNEMEKGAVLDDDGVPYWSSKESIMTKLANFTTFTYGKPKVWAYRCQKCGKIELTTEVK